jgi:hypothetical protein
MWSALSALSGLQRIFLDFPTKILQFGSCVCQNFDAFRQKLSIPSNLAKIFIFYARWLIRTKIWQMDAGRIFSG